MSSRGNGTVKIHLNAETFGAATVATGTSEIDLKPKNVVSLATGTIVQAQGDVNSSAGTDTQFQRDQYEIESIR